MVKKYKNEVGNKLPCEFVEEIKKSINELKSLIQVSGDLVRTNESWQGYFYTDIVSGCLVILSNYGISLHNGGTTISLNNQEQIEKYIENKKLYENVNFKKEIVEIEDKKTNKYMII